ncbi:MAG: hypothetical protein R3B96_03680 [Pirellulaceae bacterium]
MTYPRTVCSACHMRLERYEDALRVMEEGKERCVRLRPNCESSSIKSAKLKGAARGGGRARRRRVNHFVGSSFTWGRAGDPANVSRADRELGDDHIADLIGLQRSAQGRLQLTLEPKQFRAVEVVKGGSLHETVDEVGDAGLAASLIRSSNLSLLPIGTLMNAEKLTDTTSTRSGEGRLSAKEPIGTSASFVG